MAAVITRLAQGFPSSVTNFPRSLYLVVLTGILLLLTVVGTQIMSSYLSILLLKGNVANSSLADRKMVQEELIPVSLNQAVRAERKEEEVRIWNSSGLGVGNMDLYFNNSKLEVATSHMAAAEKLNAVNSENDELIGGNCDLYHGKWIHTTTGPLYTNNTCPILTPTQNCQGNGRPDKDYESWRWKPDQCDLSPFDSTKFLELMRGKTLAYVGDSVARNQMESLLCMLWQVEAPKNRGNHLMQRWYFRSTDTTIIRIWSSWLVHTSLDPLQSIPKGVPKVHLDIPDENIMKNLPIFDVLVISSGHWFAKQSVYLMNGTIVGGRSWKSKKRHEKFKINSVEAFGLSVETVLSSVVTHPNYRGLTVLRTYSPDHYEHGAWNTGGSCDGNVRPVKKLVKNKATDAMHGKQVFGFMQATNKITNGSKLRLMDITELMGFRSDGHPGRYRGSEPNMREKQRKHVAEDCLHWCMPGPVDTWNEILLEILQREFQQV